MPESIRTFIAIELDEPIRRALENVQAQFARERNARMVRWTTPASIHITLKFLGDVEAARVPDLQRAIVEASQGIAPFTLTLRGVGAFPNPRRPNIVWVGAEGQIDLASTLANNIEMECERLGFAREERPFTPHLTIGRVKRDAAPNDRRAIGEMIERTRVEKIGELRVAQVCIMKSELRPGGSVYTRQSAIELKNDPIS